MTRLMLFLAHRMDYPPADRGADRRGLSKAAVSSSISTPAASTICTVQARPEENVRWKPKIPTVLASTNPT